MSRPPPSLKDACGGRFAFMPAVACEDDQLSPGAFRLYAAMCGHADQVGNCRFCLKTFAKKIRKSARTIQNWKLELESLGWIEELHEGDKAIGSFRVIRNPSERAPIRFKNLSKIADRAVRKTPHANRASHPRCEADFAHIKNKQDPPISPQEQSAAPSETDRNLGVAWQGNQGAAQPRAQIDPTVSVKTFSKKNLDREPDWNGWVQWLVSSRQVSTDKAWPWLMAEIERFQKEQDVSSEEAARILDQELKTKRRLLK